LLPEFPRADCTHLAITGPDFVGVQHVLIIHQLGAGGSLDRQQRYAAGTSGEHRQGKQRLSA
jgi:hypothetical protein